MAAIDAIGAPAAVALLGLAGGLLLGLAARLGRFCTLGAIEDLFYGASDTRVRMWGVALGVAVTGCYALALAGLFDPAATYFLAGGWNPIAHAAGGLLFGYGMALAGNCGYGALARLGGGDLRSFVIVLVMAISAYAVLSGPLAATRVGLFPPGLVGTGAPAGLPWLIGAATGLAPALVGVAAGLALLAWGLAPARMRTAPRPVVWGGAVGVAILSGWAGTAWLAEATFDAVPVVSHSFAGPLGEPVLWAMLASGQPLSFGVGSVAGVLAGAFAGSLIRGQFRWEACGDHRELRRQIAGAAAMGVGGAVAVGCSVGQGLSAFAVLAYSAPLTLGCIVLGAWLGLRQLIHGFAPS